MVCAGARCLCKGRSIEALLRSAVVYYFSMFNGMNPRDVRVKVKSSKGNPGSTDLISDR